MVTCVSVLRCLCCCCCSTSENQVSPERYRAAEMQATVQKIKENVQGGPVQQQMAPVQGDLTGLIQLNQDLLIPGLANEVDAVAANVFDQQIKMIIKITEVPKKGDTYEVMIEGKPVKAVITNIHRRGLVLQKQNNKQDPRSYLFYSNGEWDSCEKKKVKA